MYIGLHGILRARLHIRIILFRITSILLSILKKRLINSSHLILSILASGLQLTTRLFLYKQIIKNTKSVTKIIKYIILIQYISLPNRKHLHKR